MACQCATDRVKFQGGGAESPSTITKGKLTGQAESNKQCVLDARLQKDTCQQSLLGNIQYCRCMWISQTRTLHRHSACQALVESIDKQDPDLPERSNDYVQQCCGAGRVWEAMRLIEVRVRRQMREQESKHKQVLG